MFTVYHLSKQSLLCVPGLNSAVNSGVCVDGVMVRLVVRLEVRIVVRLMVIIVLLSSPSPPTYCQPGTAR